jgi:predicted DCC family thiol-disulfide oxidoreductase YuxK
MSAAPALRPRSLTVLYDANCPVCRQARRWVDRQRQLVPIRFVPAGSPVARRRFPDLDPGSTLIDVTVVTDTGAVLRGDRAWIAVLWAIQRTRSRAVRLARGGDARAFRGVKGATDAIRRFAATVHDPGVLPADPDLWPPPRPLLPAAGTTASVNCRT